MTINKQAKKGIQTLALMGSLIAFGSGCTIPNRAASDAIGGEIVRQSIGAAINPNSRETNVNVYDNNRNCNWRFDIINLHTGEQEISLYAKKWDDRRDVLYIDSKEKIPKEGYLVQIFKCGEYFNDYTFKSYLR